MIPLAAAQAWCNRAGGRSLRGTNNPWLPMAPHGFNGNHTQRLQRLQRLHLHTESKCSQSVIHANIPSHQPAFGAKICVCLCRYIGRPLPFSQRSSRYPLDDGDEWVMTWPQLAPGVHDGQRVVDANVTGHHPRPRNSKAFRRTAVLG